MPAPPAPVAPSPNAPTHDTSQTPSLLESLAGKVDLTDAPVSSPTQLPPIADVEEEKKKPEPKEEPKPEPDKEKEQDEEWKKASGAIAEKLFGKKPKKEEPAKKEEPKPEVKEEKQEEKKEERPKRRRTTESDITERAASAAAEAATRATADIVSKLAPKQEQKPVKPADDGMTADERKQFDVYKELEQLYPDKYRNLSSQYTRSLGEIRQYVTQWAKDNPGKSFDPDEEEHNAFFERVEPNVNEDDYIDAKATMRAREMSRKAIEPVNEKIKEMERDRARTMLEPFIREKQLEAVHLMLENFEPEIANEIRKPNGLTELNERDPITSRILNRTANVLGAITAEVVKLHDPQGGIEYDPKSELHREIADFILEQERRIAALPASERLRDGKTFISRLQFQGLPTEDKGRYWFLNQEDIIYMLSQKYGLTAKKVRDKEVEEFNKTAEKLGYRKIDVTKTSKTDQPKTAQEQAKTKEKPVSPEATSKASVRTATETPTKEASDSGTAIVGKLFPHLKSS